MKSPLFWSSAVFWCIRPLENRCSWHVKGSAISPSALCESQKTVTGIFLTMTSVFAMSRASEIAHSSIVSSIFLFFPKNTRLSFHRPAAFIAVLPTIPTTGVWHMAGRDSSCPS